MNYYTISTAERYHKGYWFTADVMRFFKSRTSEFCYTNDENLFYFISSEKGPNDKRAYSIRVVNKTTGSIDTVGEFQEYNTSAQAKKALAKLLGVKSI